MQGSKVEWLKHPYESTGDWRLAKLAIDGKVASFEVRVEDLFNHPTEESCNAMLIRQAKAYLAEFGDYRNQRRENQTHAEYA